MKFDNMREYYLKEMNKILRNHESDIIDAESRSQIDSSRNNMIDELHHIKKIINSIELANKYGK